MVQEFQLLPLPLPQNLPSEVMMPIWPRASEGTLTLTRENQQEGIEELG